MGKANEKRVTSWSGATGYILIFLWLILLSGFFCGSSARAASSGPVLPAQSNRTINEMSTLVVTNTATESGLTNGSSSLATNTYIFNYSSRSALLAGGWDFIASTATGAQRNTEITNSANGAVVSYDQNAHPGVLRIPCDVGDLWGSVNTSRNSLFRALPTNWLSMRLALSFAPTINYQQVHLSMYQDDDNFVQAGFAYNSGLGGLVTTLIWEFNATPNHFYTVLNPVSNIQLRMDHNLSNGNITQYYALNGGAWSSLGSTSQSLVNPQLCIWVGGSPVPWNSSLPSCDLQRLDVIVTNASNPALTYQLVNAPPGAAIDSNGIITWTPSEGQGPSTNTITTIVTDNRQPPLSATNSFTVVVNEVNQPPVLPSQPDQSIFGQTTLVVTNTATDPDVPAEPLTYQLISAPSGAAIDANGVITWTPSAAQVPSTNLFVTVVTDYNPAAVNAQQLSATNSFTVYVYVQPGPILPSQPNLTIDDQSHLLVTNTASEANLVVSRISTNSYFFTYTNRAALIADGWSFLATAPGGAARNTEITNSGNGALISYDQSAHPGVLRIPCDLGDLWASANNSRNTLFRSLPTNWISAQFNLSFTPTANYQQAHLMFYQDDDNYLQIGAAFNSSAFFSMDLETSGSPSTPARLSASPSSFRLRLDHNVSNGTITGYVSPDGTTWNLLASNTPAFANPRLAIWTGGSQSPYTSGFPTLDASRLDIILSNNAPTSITYMLLNPPPGMSIDTNGIISWTPTRSQAFTTNWITTVATDNSKPPLSATNTFEVIVRAIHNGPSLPDRTNVVVAELTALLVTNTAIDNDFPALQLSYSLLGAPAGVGVDTNGVISWTPTEAQGPSTNTITTVVTDNGTPPLSATNSFVIVVQEINTAPVLPVQADVSLIAQQPLIVTNTASDSDIPANSLTYVLQNAPAGAQIDSNGVVTWTPALNQVPSTNQFTTVATDYNPWAVNNQHLSATNSFNVVVQAIHNGPILPIQTNVTVAESTMLVVTNTAADNDVPVLALNYSLVNPPAGASIDTNGVITWIPGESQGPGTNVITTIVADSSSPSLNATNSFVVVVQEINVPPVLPIQSEVALIGEQPLIITNTASDSDIPANTLSYELQSAPAGAQIDTNGVITWTPALNQVPSTNQFTTVVMDYNPWAVNNQHLSATNSFSVIVHAIHNGPILPVQTNVTVAELTMLVVTNTAADNDVPALALNYSLVSAPAGASIDPNGVISWIPNEAQGPSTNMITTVVTDNGTPPLSATNSFNVVVQAIHHGPMLPVQTNVTLAELTQLVVTNTAADNDVPVLALSYSLINPPAGASIDTNGVISWIPSEAQGPSTNVITTVVADNGMPPLSATNSFVVVVEEINVPPVLPALPDVTLIGQQPLVVTNTASDSDIPVNSLSYTIENAPLGAQIDTNGVIAWTPAPTQVPSTNQFITVVTDYNPWAVNDQHLSATNSFTVIVEAVHIGPLLPLQTNVVVVELTHLIVTNTAMDNDLPPPSLSYSLIDPPAGASIDTNGVISWIPSEAQGPSTNTITAVVTDNGTPPLTATNSFVVVVEEINVPPVLPVQLDVMLIGQQLLIITNTASDSDIPVNSLSYVLQNAPAGAQIDTNGVITWTPASSQVPGTNQFTTVVTDYNPWAVNDQHLSATNSFTVVVQAIHNGPMLPVPTNITMAELTQLIVTNTAVDIDLPVLVLSYSLVNPPAGASIDTNGVISWIPSESQGPSTNIITTVVTDNGTPPLSATNSFIVVVQEINVPPVLPVLPNFTLTGQQLLVVADVANDSDIPANSLSYVLQSAPAGAQIDSNGVITWTPAADQVPSTNQFTVVVTDYNPWAVNAQHLSATNSFMVTILSPVALVIESLQIQNGSAIVTWDSVAGQTYQLQYKDDGGATDWQNAAPAVTATSPSCSATNGIEGAPTRFYRVVRLR